MEIDMNTSRQHREGVGVATPVVCFDEGLKDFRMADSVFVEVLDDALRQCLVLDDFEKASSRWMMAERMALKMGAPASLVIEYGSRLLAHFERRKETADPARSLIEQLVLDNHGNINHHKE